LQAGATAESKEKVLQALGRAASELREKLGESLASIQKYDTPLREATTTSLEALKAYSLGLRTLGEKGPEASIPYFKRAIELDPNFAQAYAFLATEYGNIGEAALASDYAKRAYDLRDRVTEHEKIGIEMQESSYVTGDLVKDEETAQLWKRTYPRDVEAYKDVGADQMARGDFQDGLLSYRQALQTNRFDAIAVSSLAFCYCILNRLDEAKVVLDQGLADGIDPEALAGPYYSLAFLRNNMESMQKQVGLVMDKPGYEDYMLALQSDTEAYHGRLKQARESSRQATESARHNGNIEVAANFLLAGALREGEFGNFLEARQVAASAIQLSPQSRFTRGVAALALARAGGAVQAAKDRDGTRHGVSARHIVEFLLVAYGTRSGRIEPAQRIEGVGPVALDARIRFGFALAQHRTVGGELFAWLRVPGIGTDQGSYRAVPNNSGSQRPHLELADWVARPPRIRARSRGGC
jgi:tetratricopeptide (TPR) repeat protein